MQKDGTNRDFNIKRSLRRCLIRIKGTLFEKQRERFRVQRQNFNLVKFGNGKLMKIFFVKNQKIELDHSLCIRNRLLKIDFWKRKSMIGYKRSKILKLWCLEVQ